MKLIEVVNTYVSMQRSRGMRFDSTERLLRRFARNMGVICIDEIGPQQMVDFLRGSGPLSATWVLKHRFLSGLYRFATSRGHANHSPLPTSLPSLPPQQTPYVYSTEELRRLIDATSTLHVAKSRLQAPTYRILILTLYGGGLRVGEAM